MLITGKSIGCDNRGLRICIRTFGCQMNVRDSEVICGLLRADSYELTTEPEEADVVIFNTCSVRQHAEDKVWSEIGRIAKSRKRRKRGLSPKGTVPVIGLVGCMAQNYKDQVFERAPEVDFVVGPSDIAKIPSIIARVAKSQSHNVTGNNLQELKVWETDGEVRPEEIYHTGFYEDKEHAYLVISEGCSNMCSYCVVPYVRGPLHNRNYKDILKEIERGLAKGITKFTLLGQNVNAYLYENVNFVELVNKVNKVKGLKEFSFITSHPKDTTVELFKAMADCAKLKKYLHLPVQSGSDKILKNMNRGYARKFYLDLAKNYRKIVKSGALTSDIIVGFSGESEEDFRDSYNLVKEVEFDAAFIFKYSPRPQSQAYTWMDDVPKKEKERRHKLILDLQKEISKRKNAKK
jgi:tRNA-2-methylthio-N6-dimethylallyladenosine synthase